MAYLPPDLYPPLRLTGRYLSGDTFEPGFLSGTIHPVRNEILIIELDMAINSPVPPHTHFHDGRYVDCVVQPVDVQLYGEHPQVGMRLKLQCGQISDTDAPLLPEWLEMIRGQVGWNLARELRRSPSWNPGHSLAAIGVVEEGRRSPFSANRESNALPEYLRIKGELFIQDPINVALSYDYYALTGRVLVYGQLTYKIQLRYPRDTSPSLRDDGLINQVIRLIEIQAEQNRSDYHELTVVGAMEAERAGVPTFHEWLDDRFPPRRFHPAQEPPQTPFDRRVTVLPGGIVISERLIESTASDAPPLRPGTVNLTINTGVVTDVGRAFESLRNSTIPANEFFSRLANAANEHIAQEIIEGERQRLNRRGESIGPDAPVGEDAFDNAIEGLDLDGAVLAEGDLLKTFDQLPARVAELIPEAETEERENEFWKQIEGYWVVLPNGYVVSVAFGPGFLSSNEKRFQGADIKQYHLRPGAKRHGGEAPWAAETTSAEVLAYFEETGEAVIRPGCMDGGGRPYMELHATIEFIQEIAKL